MNMKYAMRSEDTEQINVISWASWQMQKYPELKWLHHIPNGGSRNRAEAVKLKQMGVKSGVSDLCLPYPKGIYCGLYIEMKFEAFTDTHSCVRFRHRSHGNSRTHERSEQHHMEILT